jgi:hypothetical protein
MAEKIETILRRNTLNTRPRDFYDIYIISKTQTYDKTLLKDAIAATAAHRGTVVQIADAPALLNMIAESTELQKQWEKYRKEFNYAIDITYEQVLYALSDVCVIL